MATIHGKNNTAYEFAMNTTVPERTPEMPEISREAKVDALLFVFKGMVDDARNYDCLV